MMRFAPLALDEWFDRCRGVGINLDSSGAPSPYDEFSAEVEEGQSPLDLEERLVRLLSTILRVEEDRIALTFGCQNANSLVLLTQLSPSDTVVVEDPVYEPMRTVAEAVCRVVPLSRRSEDGFQPDLEELDRLAKGASLVMITNLHNPSAAMLDRDMLRAMADIAADRGVLLLCDEIYREMCHSTPPPPVHRFQEVGVTTDGLTKLYGLGDLRVGWTIGPPHVAIEVERARLAMASNLPTRSLALAVAALKKADWFRERMLSRARENLVVLEEWSEREPGVKFRWPQGALMFLLPLPPGVDDMEFSELLLHRYDTAVCPGSFFGAVGQVRVTFSLPPSQFRMGLENISLALDHYS